MSKPREADSGERAHSRQARRIRQMRSPRIACIRTYLGAMISFPRIASCPGPADRGLQMQEKQTSLDEDGLLVK